MVVCMTRQLDTLHEEPLRTEDFGEGMPSCVYLISSKTDL